MRYRWAAGLLLVCLIPANVCQGSVGKGIQNGDTKIEEKTKGSVKIKPKKSRLKKTPKAMKRKKGIVKKRKVEIISLHAQVALEKGRDGIKKEVYEIWEKEIPEAE